MRIRFYEVRVALLLSALVLFPSRADAGAAEEVAAETLFQTGRQLMEEGRFAEACTKLAESQRLSPAVGTLLYLGECHEKNGQLATAWVTFRAAAAAGRYARQDERIRMAEERANLLFSRVPRLTLVVSPSARVPGLEVTSDGVPLGPASFGEALPVDPGEHTVVATAPGRKPWTRKVTIATNGATETVEVPVLEATSSPPAAPAVVVVPAVDGGQGPASSASGHAPAPLAPAEPPPERPTSPLRPLAYALGGAGVVGLAVGTAFGLIANSKLDSSNEHCHGDARVLCSAEGMALRDDARGAATVANVSFGLGAAALVGGGVLFFLAPRQASSPSVGRVQVAPWVLGRSSGLSVSGAF